MELDWSGNAFLLRCALVSVVTVDRVPPNTPNFMILRPSGGLKKCNFWLDASGKDTMC